METTTLIRVIAAIGVVIVLGIIIFRRKNKAA